MFTRFGVSIAFCIVVSNDNCIQRTKQFEWMVFVDCSIPASRFHLPLHRQSTVNVTQLSVFSGLTLVFARFHAVYASRPTRMWHCGTLSSTQYLSRFGTMRFFTGKRIFFVAKYSNICWRCRRTFSFCFCEVFGFLKANFIGFKTKKNNLFLMFLQRIVGLSRFSNIIIIICPNGDDLDSWGETC